MWGIYFPANQIVIFMLIIMAHWLWLRCQKPRPPGALTFCLQRASNQKNHTFKQNEMNRGGSTYYWYGFFLQGFLHFSPRFTSMLCKCTNWTIEFCCIVIFFCVSCVTTVSKLRSEETAEIKSTTKFRATDSCDEIFGRKLNFIRISQATYWQLQFHTLLSPHLALLHLHGCGVASSHWL